MIRRVLKFSVGSSISMPNFFHSFAFIERKFMVRIEMPRSILIRSSSRVSFSAMCFCGKIYDFSPDVDLSALNLLSAFNFKIITKVHEGVKISKMILSSHSRISMVGSRQHAGRLGDVLWFCANYGFVGPPHVVRTNLCNKFMQNTTLIN